MSADDRRFCVLEPEGYLQRRECNIWDCYSEHSSSFNDRLHFHSFYELSVIYEGSSRFMVNGALFDMGVGSIQLIRPCDYHRQLTSPGEHIRYFNLMFSSAWLSAPLLRALEQAPGSLCATARGGEWDELLRLTRRVFREFTGAPDDPLAQTLVRCGVECLCVYLLRHHAADAVGPSDAPSEAIRRAVAYIHGNYRGPLRLSDAARAAGLSPAYFSAVFHRAMGASFSQYLLEFRLQMAQRYLRLSGLNVKEAAAACGFASYPHFVTAFRRAFGLTPGQWRAQGTGDPGARHAELHN